MNYYRQPIHKTLGISATYTTEDLVAFTEKLILKTNAIQVKITKNDTLPVILPHKRSVLFSKTPQGFNTLAILFPDLHTIQKALKLPYIASH